MRFAIVSDVHANAQAWAAVWIDIAGVNVDRVICLGDVVGYGPDPADVLAAMHAHVHHFVLGNHDAALCGRIRPDLFNGDARAVIEWTAGRLSPQARKLMRTWPLSLRGPGFRCVHGDFADPAAFRYVIDPRDAEASWARTDERLLFVGHTHEPGIFLLGGSGIPRRVDPQDVAIEPDRRYLVSVPSVGQPRDGEACAGYCLYDSDGQELFWRRVPFDLDAYRRAVEASGRPGRIDAFLDADPRRNMPALRKRLSFDPPAAADEGARDAVGEVDVTAMKREVRRWKYTVAALGSAALVVVTGIGVGVWQTRARPTVLAAPLAQLPRAFDYPTDAVVAGLPETPVEAGASIPGWTIVLADRRHQSVSLRRDPEWGPVLDLVSSGRAGMLRIQATPVAVEPGMRMTAETWVRRAEDFEGDLVLAVAVTRGGEGGRETLDHFVVKEPNLRRREGWWAARATFTLPANAESAQLELRGRFDGNAEAAMLELRRR